MVPEVLATKIVPSGATMGDGVKERWPRSRTLAVTSVRKDAAGANGERPVRSELHRQHEQPKTLFGKYNTNAVQKINTTKLLRFTRVSM